MSLLLDQAARLDTQRREDLEASDAQLIQGTASKNELWLAEMFAGKLDGDPAVVDALRREAWL